MTNKTRAPVTCGGGALGSSGRSRVTSHLKSNAHASQPQSTKLPPALPHLFPSSSSRKVLRPSFSPPPSVSLAPHFPALCLGLARRPEHRVLIRIYLLAPPNNYPFSAFSRPPPLPSTAQPLVRASPSNLSLISGISGLTRQSIPDLSSRGIRRLCTFSGSRLATNKAHSPTYVDAFPFKHCPIPFHLCRAVLVTSP